MRTGLFEITKGIYKTWDFQGSDYEGNVFWYMTLCSPCIFIDVSEERAASIFMDLRWTVCSSETSVNISQATRRHIQRTLIYKKYEEITDDNTISRPVIDMWIYVMKLRYFLFDSEQKLR
jgi:hypothetical protein